MVVTGLIRPPPEIRAVVDRTAVYVAKNGRGFEQRILSSNKGKSVQFSFLQLTSPFHAYYEDRIKFFENENKEEDDNENKDNENTDSATTPTKPSASVDKQDDSTSAVVATIRPQQGILVAEKTQKAASIIDPIAKALLDQRTKIEDARAKQEEEEEAAARQREQEGETMGGPTTSKPPPATTTILPPPPPLELVNIVAPGSLSAAQIETIQVVAQFAALDTCNTARSSTGNTGGQFLQQLSLREWNNADFAFCQPRHAHFAYFSALVDAYRRIFTMWTSAARTHGNAKPNSSDDENNKNQRVSTSIHDNVNSVNGLSKKVASGEQEERDLMKRMHGVLEQAAYRAEYESDWEKRKSQRQEEEEDLAAIDWHDFVVVETIDFPVDEVVELSMLPPPSSLSATTATMAPTETGDDNNATAQSQSVVSPSVAGATKTADMDDAMDESEDDEDDQQETIRVVPSYTPKVVATSNPQTARAIDPITGKSVSVADMPEHMRIQLLDPKWAEERKKFQEKQKDSNLVGGDAIASNVSRFAQARGDLFGKSEQDLLANELDSQKRREEASRILREQAHLPQEASVQQAASAAASVGPTFPSAPSKRPMEAPVDSIAKRLRPDTADSIGLPPPHQSPPLPPPPPPLPPPPPGFDGVVPVPAAPLQHPASVDVPPPGGSMGTAGVLLKPPPAAPGVASTDPIQEGALSTDNTKTGETLSEAEFAASLSKPDVTLQIRIPNDPSQMAWNFYGQILPLSVNVMSKVKAVKEELARVHLNGMPANKIQLKDTNLGFLRDAMTLASLNIGPTATLEMIPKTRGGRK